MAKTLFQNAKILDVINKQVIEGSILVENGIIAAVGADVAADGADVVDMGGKAILPGLFNGHVHLVEDETANFNPNKSICNVTLDALQYIKDFIESGVTFIRDMGGMEYVEMDLRAAAAQGRIVAPDMQVSGYLITMTGGHGWFMGREADGPDECRKAAREQLKKGADWVKIMATGGIITKGAEPGAPQLTEEEMRAAIEEAHKCGVRTATHAQGMTGIKNALRAGIDTIEHGFFMDDWCFDWMKEHNVYYVPTLAAVYWILKTGVAGGVPEFMVRKAESIFDAHQETFRNAYKAGVKIVLGTDAGTPYNPHSKTAFEMILMRDAGMDIWDVLRSGTIVAAEMCSVEKTHGSIEVGKRANLTVYAENPLDNLETVMDCRMTVIGGKIVYQK